MDWFNSLSFHKGQISLCKNATLATHLLFEIAQFCWWHQLLQFTCHFLQNTWQMLAKCLPNAWQTLDKCLPNACQMLAKCLQTMRTYQFCLLCFASCLLNAFQTLAKNLRETCKMLAKNLPITCQTLLKRIPKACQTLAKRLTNAYQKMDVICFACFMLCPGPWLPYTWLILKSLPNAC